MTVEEAIDTIRAYVQPPRKHHLAVQLIQDLDETTRRIVLSQLHELRAEDSYFRVLVTKFQADI
jgi:hypothetical protein